jgi:hypothetical protein
VADSPFNVGSGKPTISRVPEGGGGAFRPRPVAAPTQGPGPQRLSPLLAPEAAPTRSVEAGEAPRPESAPADAGDAALWSRMAAIEARRRAVQDQAQRWANEGMKTDG